MAWLVSSSRWQADGLRTPRTGGRGVAIAHTNLGAIAVTRISLLISASDDGPRILTWLLRIACFTHSDCSKVGDEEYVTGKYPAEE